MKQMRNLRRLAPVALALISGFLSSSCVVKRVITRHGKTVVAGAAPVLKTSTRDELNTRLSNLYRAIASFQATVDMSPSVGSVYKGAITEIKDVRGYVLFRKPDEIRIIGLLPVVRTKAFDMVSNGMDFKLYLVSRNLFVEGSNTAPPVSKNAIENLRPDAFLSSMLVRPAEPGVEIAALQDLTDEDNAQYILQFLRKASDGSLVFSRSVWFDRLDLSITRQIVFDETGEILSDTRYSNWQPYNAVMFPAHVDINRPKDGYGVVMNVVDMQMNPHLANDKFELSQPDGTQLQTIGAPK
jgi:outer membrane lipoprotein-sorting protein